jgi:hypothetical protein
VRFFFVSHKWPKAVRFGALPLTLSSLTICPLIADLFPLLLTCLLVVQCIDASTQGSTLSVVAAPPSLRLSDETHPIDGSSIADFVSLTLGYSLPTVCAKSERFWRLVGVNRISLSGLPMARTLSHY